MRRCRAHSALYALPKNGHSWRQSRVRGGERRAGCVRRCINNSVDRFIRHHESKRARRYAPRRRTAAACTVLRERTRSAALIDAELEHARRGGRRDTGNGASTITACTAISAPRRVWRREMRRRYTTACTVRTRRCRNAARVGANHDKTMACGGGEQAERRINHPHWAPRSPHHFEFGDARCAVNTRPCTQCMLGAAETPPMLAPNSIKQWRVAVGKRTKRELTIHSAHRNLRTTLNLATQDAPPTRNLVHRSYSALPQRRDYWRKTR